MVSLSLGCARQRRKTLLPSHKPLCRKINFIWFSSVVCFVCFLPHLIGFFSPQSDLHKAKAPNDLQLSFSFTLLYLFLLSSKNSNLPPPQSSAEYVRLALWARVLEKRVQTMSLINSMNRTHGKGGKGRRRGLDGEKRVNNDRDEEHKRWSGAKKKRRQKEVDNEKEGQRRIV